MRLRLDGDVARRKTAPRSAGPTHDEIVAEYRHRLTQPAQSPIFDSPWPPVTIGPTWQRTDEGLWLLPERSLGWDVLGWCGTWLQHGRDRPWRFTDEQARFVLWWYALDDQGRFLDHDGVLQRLKGWGKDPVGACLLAVELLGPCRFYDFDDDDTPIATDVPDAWVQTAAVSLEQTKNTMRLLPGLFTAAAKKRFRLQIGIEQAYAFKGERFLQAVTSSPATLEGARSTFVLLNETQHWTASNQGHEMAAVVERNTTKSPDGAARTLRITNAPEPGEDSVAERDRDAYEAIVTGKSDEDLGLLYDSLEASPKAPLSIEAAPDVVRGIRGDSVWLNPERIVKSIKDPRNPASRSRRFWYNQIVAAEDAWAAPHEVDRIAELLVAEQGEIITLGFDGSKSHDSTALIGCRVSDGHVFTLEIWQAKTDDEEWEIDRIAVDAEVAKAFRTYDVVGFYSDVHPFESYIDAWAEEFGEGLLVKASPRHVIGWDMRSRGDAFTKAAESFHDAMVEQQFTFDGDPRLRAHIVNARRRPNRAGVSFGKEHRESRRKVDGLAAAVLARLARQDYIALPAKKKRRKKTGRAAFA